MPKRHPRTRFGKAALAATKWCKTTQNMSFGPNLVDWKRFGRKSRKKFRWPELVPKWHPRTRFHNGALAATKWGETTQNMSLGPKIVDWMRFGRKTKKLELELPRLLAPDLPTNGSSLRDLDCTHSNYQKLTRPVLLFIVTTSPCQDWVIYAPAAFLGCGSHF